MGVTRVWTGEEDERTGVGGITSGVSGGFGNRLLLVLCVGVIMMLPDPSF